MAIWRGWGRSSDPRPPGWVPAPPAPVAASTMQELTGSPSSQTVQAPQLPCSQPNLGLVTSRYSRSNCSRLVWTGASTERRFPLSLKEISILAMASHLFAQAGRPGQDTRHQHAGQLATVPGGAVHIVDGLDLAGGRPGRGRHRLRGDR